MPNPRRFRPALLGCPAFLLFLAATSPAADAQCELVRLVASDAEEYDWLGTTASLSGDFGFVGAYKHDAQGDSSGAVYVVQKGPAGWSFTDKLMASDGTAGTQFGLSLSVDGDRVLVGGSSAAYAFERTPAGWVEVQKLVGSDILPGERFGDTVRLDGDRALVAAPYKDTPVAAGAGKVYVFEREASGWSEVAALFAADGRDDDRFGIGLGLAGDVAVVGSPAHDLHGFSAKGAAYVFQREPADWDGGTKLTIYEGGGGDQFGDSIAVHRDRLAICAPGEDSIVGGHGAVYVFRKGPGAWTREARLIPDSAIAHGFAEQVDMTGDKVFVGAYLAGDPGMQAGRVFVYKRTAAGWRFEYRFGGSVQHTAGAFGSAVSVDGDVILVGARDSGDLCNGTNCPSGAAFVFSASVASSTNFCGSAASSTGLPAVISVAGCTQVAGNEMSLFARPVPEGKPGIFFYGDGRLGQMPFGDGFRCVGGRVFRLPLTQAVGEELSWDLDLTSPPQPGGQITAGSTWYFQAYYRDPAAGGAGFNLSDALEVAFPD